MSGIFLRRDWSVSYTHLDVYKRQGQPFALDTIFYLAFAAVFRFAHVAVQATGTRLFMITMLITDQTVYAEMCIRDRGPAAQRRIGT